MPGEVPILQGKIDVALSNFAQKYRNNQFFAELLFPRVPVMKQSDKYWIFGRESQKLPENDLRAPTAAAERIVQTISTDSYKAEDHALERLIADEERANFEAGSVEQWAVETLTEKILLALEDRVAKLANTAATYPTGNKVQLSGTAQWGEATEVSKPIDDVLAGHKKLMEIGRRANTLFLGVDAWIKLKTNKQIRDRVSPTQTGPVTTENLAAIFEVERVVVPAAVKLSAAGVASFVWNPKNAILAYVNPAASFEDASFGKLFVWTAAPGSTGGFIVESGRATPVSRKADEIAVHFYYDEKVTSNISAYFIESAVA